MEQTGTRQANTMTTNEKWVMASTAAGFSLENIGYHVSLLCPRPDHC